MNILLDVDMEEQCRKLASAAVQALLEEAVLYPKPGLVDPVSAGAHTDMDITTFMRSAGVLSFGFYEYAAIGSRSIGHKPEQTGYGEGSAMTIAASPLCTSKRETAAEICKENHIPEAAVIRRCLRAAGLTLERTMFAATNGINTHKGAIFLFGYLLAAAGRLYGKKVQLVSDYPAYGITHRLPLPKSGISAANFFSELRYLAAGIFEEDTAQIKRKETLTHGEQMFLQYGCKGIRGAVEAGLPLVERNITYLSERANLPQREAYLRTLLHIIAENEDTNVLYRAGPEGLSALQERCTELLNAKYSESVLYRAVEALDAYCKAQNINPGGSADLFAAVLFCRNII